MRNDDRSVLAQLAALAGIRPDAATHAAAVVAIRRSRHRVPRAIALAAAASILLGVGTAFVVALRPADALAESAAAEATTRAYAGWIAVTRPPATRPTLIYRARDRSQATFHAGDPTGAAFEFVDRACGERWWDGGTLHRFGLYAGASRRETASASPICEGDPARRRLEAMRRRSDARVTSRREGDIEVFDVGGETVRVDVATRRVGFTLPPRNRGAAAGEYRYRYDVAVPDVYALGVPRDAPVVEDRPTGEAKGWLDAWDAAANAGPPPGVTVVARAAGASRYDGQPVPDQLVNVARRGDAWLAARYRVGAGPGTDGEAGQRATAQLPRPAGWPTATAADAFAAVAPYEFVAHTAARTTRTFSSGQSLTRATRGNESSTDGFLGPIYPTSDLLGVNTGGTRVAADAATPRLRVELTMPLQPFRVAYVNAVDVDATGMPTRWTQGTFFRDVEDRRETQTVRAFARVDGRTLPSRWTTEAWRRGQWSYSFDCAASSDGTAAVPEAWWTRAAAEASRPITD